MNNMNENITSNDVFWCEVISLVYWGFRAPPGLFIIYAFVHYLSRAAIQRVTTFNRPVDEGLPFSIIGPSLMCK